MEIQRFLRSGFVAVGVSATLAAVSVLPATGAETSKDRLLEGAGKLNARASYQTYCESCHGPAGDGRDADGKPITTVDFTGPAAAANLDRDAILAAIGQGHDEATRTGWARAVGDGEAGSIAGYIREAFMLPTPAADASVGQQIYARTCSVCHGERGNAASWAQNSLYPPPRDFTKSNPAELTRRKMVNAAIYGSDNTAMMPFATQYSEAELAAVVDYIRSAFMQPATAGAHGRETTVAALPADAHAQHGHGGDGGDMSAPFVNLLVGDAQEGRTFYNDNCAECHGRDGKGDGPRAYFINPRPRDFTSPKARAELNRPHLFGAISMGVRGREMAAWSKVIDEQQIADVAEYVFQAFIQPGAAAEGGLGHSDEGLGMPAATGHGHSDDAHGHDMPSEAVKKN